MVPPEIKCEDIGNKLLFKLSKNPAKCYLFGFKALLFFNTLYSVRLWQGCVKKAYNSDREC